MKCLWGKFKKKSGSEATKVKKISVEMDPKYKKYQGEGFRKVEFSPNYKLEDNQVFEFEVTDEIKSKITNEFILNLDATNTTAYNQLKKEEWTDLDYLVYGEGENLYFQRIIGKKHLHKKKVLWYERETPVMEDRIEGIIIDNKCDFIYNKITKKIYFKDFIKVSRVLKGFDNVYREATQGEVDRFLSSSFITKSINFDSTNLTSAKRRKVALAKDRFDGLNSTQKTSLVKYGKKYHGGIFNPNDQIFVQSNECIDTALKIIFEHYYTTEVTNEPREVNSAKKVVVVLTP